MKLKTLYSNSIILLLFIFTSNIYSQHTFSIVAVDPVTGEIGSAGATCISAEDGALAISDIVLGIGAIHTQAYWHPTNQTNARNRMLAGDSPQQVIDWLVANDVGGSPSYRQYGVVDLNDGNPRSAAYTGSSTDDVKLHKTGSNYSIQGNILISADVVNDMETAFLNASGTLADKLMAALQGAKRPGADSRCLSYGISSASSFLRVAQPSDTDSSYGNLSLDLNVWITSDVFEPIDELQDLYTEYLITEDFESNEYRITPNPATESFEIKTDNTLINGYEVYNSDGRLIEKNNLKQLFTNILIDTSEYDTGVYFVKVFNNNQLLFGERIIIE